MNKPEVWMISMSDCEISQHYKNICKPTWEEKGFVVNDSEAITPSKNPEIVQGNIIKLTKKVRLDGEVWEFTETEKAVWHSHLFLWLNCMFLKTPIIVAEHDIKLLEEISIEEGVGFAFLCHSQEKESLLPCGSYYITPKVAEYLVEMATEFYETLNLNVDGFLATEIGNLMEMWADSILSETPVEEIEQVYDKLSKDAVTYKDFYLGNSFGRFLYQIESCQSVFDEEIGKTIEHNIKKVGRIGSNKTRRTINDLVKKTLS